MVFETPDEMSAGKKLSTRRGLKISFSRKSSSKHSAKLTALTESDNVDVIASPIAEESQEKASNEPEIDMKSGSIPTKSPSVKSTRWRFKSKRSGSNENVKTEPKISDDDKLESRGEPGSNSAEKSDPTECPQPGIGDINEACVGSDESKCPTSGIGNGAQHTFYVKKGVGYVVPVRRGDEHLLTRDNLSEHFYEKANLNGDQDSSDASSSNGSSSIVMNGHLRQQLDDDSQNIPNETAPPRIPPKPASLRSRPLPSPGPSKSLSKVNEELDNSDIPPRPPARPKNRALGKQRLWPSSGRVKSVGDNRATVYEIISLVPKESCLAEELAKLPRQPWYWGPLTQAQAEEKLDKLPDGNFLVRDSSDERYLLSLSFNSHGRTLHTRIEHRNGLFSLNDSDGHTSIVELVECAVKESRSGVYGYMRDALGVQSFPARLTDWVSRFTEMRSLQHLCRFLIREVYPRHHIQRLPLPKKIKEYILENQY